MCALCEAGGRGFHSTSATPSDAASARSSATFTNPARPEPRGDGPRFDFGDFGDWFSGPRGEREPGHFEIDWGGFVRGGSITDSLIGGNGDDILRGGNGADTFLFNAGLFGNDTVSDFTDGSDQFEFDGIAGVDDFTDLVITANGGNALITLPDGSTITLTGINSAVLDASDFVFGP